MYYPNFKIATFKLTISYCTNVLYYCTVLYSEGLHSDELGAMLKKLGLTDLQDKFEEEDVTIDDLLSLTDDNLKELLKKELGIQKWGQRKKILNALKQKKSETGFEKYVIITVLRISILASHKRIFRNVSSKLPKLLIKTSRATYEKIG